MTAIEFTDNELIALRSLFEEFIIPNCNYYINVELDALAKLGINPPSQDYPTEE